jgi:signal transduction histidine kinase/CheY-like chemotaxis protein
MAFLGVGVTTARAQSRVIEESTPGLIETGAPLFEVRTYQSLGLDASPTNLHVLPDGRLLLIAGHQIAIGDGLRWERFQQSAEDPLTPAQTVAVDHDGKIYMGVVGGFACVEFGQDARWHLRLVATWTGDSAPVPALRFVVQTGNDWFWHGESGPVVSWRPGKTSRIMGRAGATEYVFRLKDDLFVSDSTSGSLARITDRGLVEIRPMPAVTAWDTMSCAVPYDADRLLVGTFGRGLKLFDGAIARDFPNSGKLGEGARINALREISAGVYVAAVEGYGLVFFDREGRTIQVLSSRLAHQLNHIRQLRVTGDTIVGLLADGIVRVEFPSRLSHYEPLAASRLISGEPLRVDGRLWLFGDGHLMRGTYDEHGLIDGFETDSPPGSFVFSVSTATGRLLVFTEKDAYWRTKDAWVPVGPDLGNARIISDTPVAGRWLYNRPNEVGWLRPTDHGLEIERFAAPQLGTTYGHVAGADGTSWLEQGNSRIGRVRVTDGKPVAESFGREAGIPDGWAQIFSLDGEIYFNVGRRILRFDERSRRFVQDEKFARDFPGITNIAARPAIDPLGRLWIVTNGSVHVLEGKRGQWRDLNEPMPLGFIPYSFTFEKNGTAWLHNSRRLVRFDPGRPAATAAPFRALISHLKFLSSGRTEFPTAAELAPLADNDNSFSAHFVAPNCPFGSAVDFEVKLDGANLPWASTGAGGSTTFNHLKPGSYVLRVRPRAADAVGGEASLGFTVRSPWYLTRWAYFGYVAGLIALATTILRTVSALQRRDKIRLERLVEERTQELNAGIERRRRLEAQLLQAQKLESLGTLAGGIAHDFNNLLTSILGNCELAIMTAGDDPSVGAELRQIMAAGGRARDLVAQILTFSRQRNIALSPINLARPVADAIKLIRASTPATVEISSHLSDGNVQADSTQIHQIVINLCHNAVQAMSGHAGRIEVTLKRIEITETFAAELPGLAPGAAMHLSVSDTGCGMNAGTLERVFDPFFTTKAPGEGTGLGLSIVQGIVHGHKGVVRVSSQPGQGTTFDLYFPVTTDEVVTLPVAGKVPLGRQEKIMVVDDEPSVASYVARQLERLGYSPTVFTDPHAALAEVISAPQRFQAIVTDLTMPKLSGVELVERCRAAGATMPVTIITGYGTDELQATLQTFTRCNVLSKPFDGDDLARVVHRMLQNETTPPM